jgi:hypothetical protein
MPAARRGLLFFQHREPLNANRRSPLISSFDRLPVKRRFDEPNGFVLALHYAARWSQMGLFFHLATSSLAAARAVIFPPDISGRRSEKILDFPAFNGFVFALF